MGEGTARHGSGFKTWSAQRRPLSQRERDRVRGGTVLTLTDSILTAAAHRDDGTGDVGRLGGKKPDHGGRNFAWRSGTPHRQERGHTFETRGAARRGMNTRLDEAGR